MKANLIPSLGWLESVPQVVWDLVPTLLADQNDGVISATIQVLIDLRVEAQQYISTLNSLVSKSTERVRTCIASFLCEQTNATPEIIELLRVLVCDSSDRVKLIAASYLCRVVSDFRGEELFLRILRDSKEPFQRALAVAGLSHSTPLTPETKVAIVRSLHDPHPIVIGEAIYTLMDHQFFAGGHRTVIEGFRNHPDEYVRAGVEAFLTYCP